MTNKISRLMKNQRPINGFPVRGVEGYGGEQDGTTVLLTDVLRFPSRKVADEKHPAIPDYLKLHWGQYTPGNGWEIVLGCWSDKTTEDNPFRME